MNEIYAGVFGRCYGLQTVGLRYFNVFGPRQDPDGAYAAVIPKWTAAMIQGEDVFINGDGETSRDFCYVANTVQANILAATASSPKVRNQIYNVAVGDRSTLNTLFELIKDVLATLGVESMPQVKYRDFRSGDVRHSQANINKAKKNLGFEPTHTLFDGLSEAIPWYMNQI